MEAPEILKVAEIPDGTVYASDGASNAIVDPRFVTIRRKIHLHVLAVCICFYIFAFLDRTSSMFLSCYGLSQAH